MIAFVRGPTARAARFGSRLKLTSSTSTNTGFAPTRRTTSAELIHVNGVVTTSSPGPIPRPRNAISRLTVPLPVVIAWRTPTRRASSRSSSSISGPMMNRA